MTCQVVKLQELAAARAKVYQLLATIYIKPPVPEFLKLLEDWIASLSKAESPFQLLSRQMRDGLTALEEFFRKAEEYSVEKLEEAVSVEFTRLFRGVKPFYSPLPPYESVYREEAQRVFSESTFEVHQEYRRFGIDLVNGVSGEPPDHISLEFEFMYYLCSQEAEAWDMDNESKALSFLEAEKEFLRKHLMIWLPQWCEEVRKYDRLSLFGGLADITEGWVNFDYEQHLQDIEQGSSRAPITEGYSDIEGS